jgi:methylenetetrahydrofolate dehydrogenase (NADP+)/methenyltetrahydrofolate cyclohydrolase
MLFDGKALAATVREEITAEVARFKDQRGFTPAIAVVQVEGDPASERYVRQIGKSFEGVGMGFQLKLLPADSPQDEVVEVVRDLSRSREVSGIIVQIPLPKHIAQEAVVAAIDPAKDVDGVNPINAGRLLAGTGDCFAPATPSGGMEILRRYDIPIKGREAVVVGRSNIVGKPAALLLLHEHATVTICHSRTPDLGAVTRRADILIAAVGKARIITGDMIKPGAAVIDFGVNIVDGKPVGDVDFDSAQPVAGGITPVPGGTGPMTNIMLMRNTLRAAEQLAG